MARKITKAKFEKVLNRQLTSNNTIEQALEKYQYLFGNEYFVKRSYYNYTLGTNLRTKDLPKFNVLYAEHLKKQ